MILGLALGDPEVIRVEKLRILGCSLRGQRRRPESTKARAEIEDGFFHGSLADRTVRPGEEEYFKSKARETGSISIIDIITARLDAKTDSYVAELPSLRLRDVRITPALVQQHDRKLTGGFYAEIELVCDATITECRESTPTCPVPPRLSPTHRQVPRTSSAYESSPVRSGNLPQKAEGLVPLPSFRGSGPTSI